MVTCADIFCTPGTMGQLAKLRPNTAEHAWRRNGHVRLDTPRGPGFGYRLDEIQRDLDPPVTRAGDV